MSDIQVVPRSSADLKRQGRTWSVTAFPSNQEERWGDSYPESLNTAVEKLMRTEESERIYSENYEHPWKMEDLKLNEPQGGCVMLQLERCPSTGALHWQIGIRMVKNTRGSFIKRLFADKCSRVYVKCHDSWERLMIYVQKERTRVEGPFRMPLECELYKISNGGDATTKENSTFNKVVQRLIKSDDPELEWDLALEDCFYMQSVVCNKGKIMDCVKGARMAKLQRTIMAKVEDAPLKIWQRKLCLFLTSDEARSNRKIWWFYEKEGNIGKSYLSNYLQVVHYFIGIDKGKMPDMIESLWRKYSVKTASGRSFILDLCRDQKTDDRNTWGTIPSLIEKLSNDAPISRAKYTSDSMWFGPKEPVIVVFANCEPPSQDDALWSQDRISESTFNLRSTSFCNKFSVCWRTDTEFEE